MINDKTSRSQKRRFFFPIAILFTIGWWVAGWLMPQTPPWWGLVFMLSVTTVFYMTWKFLKREASDFEQELNNHNHQDKINAPAKPLQEFISSPELARLEDHLNKSASLGAHAIRAFASLSDARHHGWEFEEPIGTYGNDTVFNVARRSDIEGYFVFDGLSKNAFSAVASDLFVTFGRMRYRKFENEASV